MINDKKTAAEYGITDIGPVAVKYTEKEKDRLRSLAQQWADIAASSKMKDCKRQWKAVQDLKMERPMVMVETNPFKELLFDSPSMCKDPYLKNVEMFMMESVGHHNILSDDVVLETYYRLPWRVIKSGNNVQIVNEERAETGAFLSNFPIKTPADIKNLRDRYFYVDRERTLCVAKAMDDIFGDILPIRVGGFDMYCIVDYDLGYNTYMGNYVPTHTSEMFQLIGNDNMMFWAYDEPDALFELMNFLQKDRFSFLDWMQSEKLVVLNTDNQFAAPSIYGYVSDLPAAVHDDPVDYSQIWVWAESQESTNYSPQMYAEFVLPYIADYTRRFGLTAYGCCEPVDDRIELVKKAIPNLRAVTVSPWNDFEKVADALGTNYSFFRKPSAGCMSGKFADWDEAKEDIEITWAATKDINVAFIFRELMDIGGDISRMAKWVRMAKGVLGI